MDIKNQVEKLVEEVTKNKDLRSQFDKEPVKVIEKVIGVDLPDEIVEKIVAAAKAKLTMEGISDAAGKLKNLF